jgi:hypothetical protein
MDAFLLAQPAYQAGRFAPLKGGAKRLEKASELIFIGFSNILARFFSRARVEK